MLTNPGFWTGIAGVIGAFAALIAAFRNNSNLQNHISDPNAHKGNSNG